MPGDPLFRWQWALENRGQAVNRRRGRPGADVAIRGAWRHTKGRPEVVVAIVDSGVDADHPDLQGQLLPQPPGESWDFSGAGERLPRDLLGHGTHVAAIVVAAENGTGIVGVAPRCRLLPLRVDLVAGAVEDRAHAIELVAQKARADPHRRYVLNGSWAAAGPDPAIERALAVAAAAEVVVVFAAGNGGAAQASYPARHPQTIGVAGTDQDDCLWELSNHGAGVDLAAPAENIYSAVPTYFAAGRRPYGFRSGTSMAAAIVAGVAALVLSAAPELGAREVRRILAATCDDVEAGTRARRLGAGRVNAARAVAAALAARSTLR